MKKSILATLIICLLVSLGCKKSSTPSPAACSATLSGEYASAIQAFSTDPTNKVKCQKVFSTLEKLIDCPFITAAQKADYKATFANNPCGGL
jgi:hypothetical protein